MVQWPANCKNKLRNPLNVNPMKMILHWLHMYVIPFQTDLPPLLDQLWSLCGWDMHCRPLGRSRLKGEALSKLSEQMGELGEEGRNGKERERGREEEASTTYWDKNMVYIKPTSLPIAASLGDALHCMTWLGDADCMHWVVYHESCVLSLSLVDTFDYARVCSLCSWTVLINMCILFIHAL